MADNVSLKVEGLADLRQALSDIPVQLRKKVLLGALRKAARVPLLAARQLVPVLDSAAVSRYPNRTPGLLKKRLTVRTSKASRAAGNIGVFINIKPAAGAKYKTSKGSDLLGSYTKRTKTKDSQRGAKSRNDPYYWRWVEFGTKKMRAQPFLKPAGESLPQALSVFMAEVIPQINKFNSRK
jgi:HK97 gp10 family phage protein